MLGIINPRIYLPFSMNEQDLEHVVAHEQAHIRRKDHWWKPLGFLLLTIYWFNPLMWLAYVLLCRDIELAHTLEMGKYNEYSPMLDIVCAGKDVEGTYKVVKHLLDNVGTMYDFRKSGLYKHMKFRDIDEAILDGVKEKLLEGFRKEEEFGYMAGYEPWEKLIFDR